MFERGHHPHALARGRDAASGPRPSPLTPAPAVLLGTVDVYADRFEERIGGEEELMKLVAEKKAAKAAAGLKSR